MRLVELPAALDAAAARLQVAAAELDATAAQAVLDAAQPPRATGALANSGRVIANAAVFGGGTVDYAAPVHKANPWLDRAVEAAQSVVLDLADRAVSAATTL